MSVATFHKTIVTGGLGFIGSHLTTRLLKTGCEVIVLDNLSTGRHSNLAQQKGNPLLTVIETDVAAAGGGHSIQDYLKGADCIFHLAAVADIVPSIQKPSTYFYSNVTGTVNVLEAARGAKVPRFIYAASSSCYGLPEVFPTPETASICPEYPYALTKNIGEQTALHWAKVYKMGAVSLRLFNVYGPRSRTTGAYGAVFGVFLAQRTAGKPLTIVGDGRQTRDFTYVTDVVEAMLVAAEKAPSGAVYNVGSGHTVPVNYLAELIGGPNIHIQKRPGEPDQTFADISKIRRELGWEPRVSFEEGVKCMLERLSDWKDAPVWTPEAIAEATQDWFKYLSK